jgi:hypothetical protein
VVRPALNRRIQSLAAWSAYVRWCAAKGIDAVSHARFGRLARWRKERIGGTAWYLDCELAEGYTDLPHTRESKVPPKACHLAIHRPRRTREVPAPSEQRLNS